MSKDKYKLVGGVYQRQPKPKTSFGEIIGSILFFGFVLFLIAAWIG